MMGLTTFDHELLLLVMERLEHIEKFERKFDVDLSESRKRYVAVLKALDIEYQK